MTDSTPHSSQEPAEGPAVGQDEWVARHGERRLAARRRARDGRGAAAARALVGVARALRRASLCAAPGGVERAATSADVAFDTVLYMLLALGLNVVVGWGGLLDLGYVAFYGIGAYTYAMLDSDKFGVHLPTIVSVPLIVVIGALARAACSACRRGA